MLGALPVLRFFAVVAATGSRLSHAARDSGGAFGVRQRTLSLAKWILHGILATLQGLRHLLQLIQRGALKVLFAPGLRLHHRQQVVMLLDGWHRLGTRGRGLRRSELGQASGSLGAKPRPSSLNASRMLLMRVVVGKITARSSFF